MGGRVQESEGVKAWLTHAFHLGVLNVNARIGNCDKNK